MRWFLSAALLAATSAHAQDASAPLDGLSTGQVRTMLGQPELLTRDNPVQIWQYGNDVCVIHVFFYPQADGGLLAVEHVETRMRSGFADRPDLCQAALAGEPLDPDSAQPEELPVEIPVEEPEAEPPEVQPVTPGEEPGAPAADPSPASGDEATSDAPAEPAPVDAQPAEDLPTLETAPEEADEPAPNEAPEADPVTDSEPEADAPPAQPIIPYREPAQRRTPVQIDMVPLN